MSSTDEVAPSAYALVLVAWWREIVLVTIAAAALGAAANLALQLVSPRFDAYADVALIETRAEVAIDNRFGAVSGAVRRTSASQITGRRAALLGLVHKSSLAQTVSDMLSEEIAPSDLLPRISAKLVTFGVASQRPESDLIRITARMGSPAQAKFVADAWAQAYVHDINNLYQQVSKDTANTIELERDKVHQQYQEAEAELQQLMAANRIDFFTEQIDSLAGISKELMDAWKESFATRFILARESKEKLLQENLELRRFLSRSLSKAKSLRSQIRTGKGAGVESNALAIALFKAHYYASDSTNVEISFDALPSGNADRQLADITSMIASIQKRIVDLDEEIDTTSLAIESFVNLDAPSAPASPDSTRQQTRLLSDLAAVISRPLDEQPLLKMVESIESSKQDLVARREMEASALADLTLRRDLRRSTLETLQTEIVELQLRNTSSQSEVRLASLSITPSSSAWHSAKLTALALGVLAFFGSVCIVFVANATGQRPFIAEWRQRLGKTS